MSIDKQNELYVLLIEAKDAAHVMVEKIDYLRKIVAESITDYEMCNPIPPEK